MNHVLRGLLGLVLASILAPAPAQERATRSALIIGVSSYSTPLITPLPGVPHDVRSAKAIAAAMGIAPERTTVLLDAEATLARIVAALEQLGRSTAEGGRVFVYFSGHGTRWFDAAAGNCREGLISYDWQAIGHDEIARHLRRVGEVADKVVVMFDACHSDGVNVVKGRTRQAPPAGLRAKFFARADAHADARTEACARPSNLRARGVLAEATRLGALAENFVQITSSRADEVSFDDAASGGIATQAVRDCLLGRASDLDASGAVSIGEVQSCAQALADERLRPYPDLGPQHITVSGNRNIVPLAVVRPPPAAAPALPAAEPPAAAPPAAAAPTFVPPTAAPPAAAPPAPVPPAPVPPAVAPLTASAATLTEVAAQRDPRRRVDVALGRVALRIGVDPLEMTLRAGHDGYVYVVMLGSDARSFYLLFPNAHDGDNAIRANRPMRLPRPGWAMAARGPVGTDRMLVMVTDTPRDLATLKLAAADDAAPFTYTLNDGAGRAALIDFLVGAGVTGRSERFGARLLEIREVAR